jgi:hypothetical protein
MGVLMAGGIPTILVLILLNYIDSQYGLNEPVLPLPGRFILVQEPAVPRLREQIIVQHREIHIGSVKELAFLHKISGT